MASSKEKLFSRITHVDADIHAGIEKVWALLTDVSAITNWNSTILQIEGEIAQGKTIRLISELDPSRSFKLKVTEWDPPKRMVWSSGMWPFFKGERSYSLTRISDDTTCFEMKETMKGLLFPLASKSIPNMEASFDQIIEDLKAAVKQK